MPRDALIAIAGGLMSASAAMAFLGGSALGLMLVYLAPVPILLIGLGKGPKAATIAAATGFLATGAFGGMMLAGVYGLVYALPAWTLTRFAMSLRPQGNGADTASGADAEWYAIGPALAALALLGAGLILLAHLMVGETGLKEALNAHMAEAVRVLVPNADEAWKVRAIEVILPLFPGAVGVSWVSMTVVNAVIAQGMLVRLGRNLRPSPVYSELELPHWASWPLILSAGAALSGPLLGMEDLGYLGRNTAMVTAIPYFFLGLAVIHTLARRVAATTSILVMVYLVVIMSGWAALVVAGVGVTEQWLGLRDRSENSDAGHGSGEDK
jgi:hypothetical protein